MGNRTIKGTIEDQYDIIRKREGSIDALKTISNVLFLISLAFLLLYPFFTLGSEKYSFINVLLNNNKESVAYQIYQTIEPIIDGEWNGEILVWFSMWYVLLKVVILAYVIIFGFFKLIFGGFRKIFNEPTILEKTKIVEKYKKKHNKTFLKNFVSWLIGAIVKLIFPPIGDLLDLKENATSLLLPIVFALMCVLSAYIPLSTISNNIIVAESVLLVDMKFVTMAMIFGVLHTVLLLIASLLAIIFNFRKLD